jgi:hypothetical protein
MMPPKDSISSSAVLDITHRLVHDRICTFASHDYNDAICLKELRALEKACQKEICKNRANGGDISVVTQNTNGGAAERMSVDVGTTGGADVDAFVDDVGTDGGAIDGGADASVAYQCVVTDG